MSSTGGGPNRQRSLKDRLKDGIAQSWPRRRGSQGSNNQAKGGRPYFIPSSVTLTGTAATANKSEKAFSLGSSSDSLESHRDNGWPSGGAAAAAAASSVLKSVDQNEAQYPSPRTKPRNSKSEEGSVTNSPHVMMTSASSASQSGSESSKGKDDKPGQDKKVNKHSAVQPPGTFCYKVDTNDTLTSVAARFETTPSELVKLNRLVNRLVFPGQIIYVPGNPADFEDELREWEDGGRSRSENSLDVSQGSCTSPPPHSMQTSPKPGRVERVGQSATSPSHRRTNLATSKRLSEEEERKLDKECMERFLKINVKHITDGQGVVDGVLLVTPNAVMFDPSVVHTLVMEHGVEKYGVIAPMDYVANAALYSDIAHMKVRHAPAGCVTVAPRPEIYQGKKDLKEGEGPCRSESQQAVKGSVSDKADLDLSEDDVVEEDEEDLSAGMEGTRTVKGKLESRTRSGGTEADDEYSSDSEVFAEDDSKRPSSGKRSQVSGEQTECPLKDSQTIEKPCDIAQLSDAQLAAADRLRKSGKESEVEAGQCRTSSSLPTTTEEAEEAEEAVERSLVSQLADTNVYESEKQQTLYAGAINPLALNTNPRVPLKLTLDDTKVPRRRMSYEPPSPSIDGWVIATRNLLEHRRGSTPDAYVYEAVNPFVQNMLAETVIEASSQLANVPEHKCVEHPGKGSRHSKEDIRVEFKSEVTIEDKKDLFQAMDKLIPRPARHSDDQPLYLCLRMGRPVNKKRLPSTTPIMSYGQRKMRSEYWFGIPKDRVDDLYNFFQHWAPGVYGDIEQMDLQERGFELVNTDDEESDEEVLTLLPKPDYTQANVAGSVANILPSAVKKIAGRIPGEGTHTDWEIIKAPYAKLFGRLRRDTPSSDSEVVSINEVNDANSLKRFYSLDLELALPELIGRTEILTDEHRKSIFKVLPARAEGYAWSLIYSASQHGFSLQSMYRCMAKVETPVLLVIQDTENNVFGAMTSCTFRVSDHFYGTGESFLYTFYPEFKVFRWTGENGFFIKGNTESLAIGAGDGLFGLWMDGDIYHGRSHPCKTYNNDTLSNSEDFCIKLLEAWGFVEYEVPDSRC